MQGPHGDCIRAPLVAPRRLHASLEAEGGPAVVAECAKGQEAVETTERGHGPPAREARSAQGFVAGAAGGGGGANVDVEYQSASAWLGW